MNLADKNTNGNENDDDDGGSDKPFVCADCGTLSPEWASINRGVLVCSECCSVHRNLGRHISQIRSLKKGAWHANQYALVLALYRNGANNVWEHSLVDAAVTGGMHKIKKKPVSNDPIIPKKETFIKAKYEQLSYAIRPSKEENLTMDDLNKQLWCCVRTSYVETTLRLLALGADPNYADAESGNTPLHIAAKENQQLQVELLCLYGADIAQCNNNGETPSAVARRNKFFELQKRIDTLEFDVTDRLSMFLCGRSPKHTHNQHFLIPELATASVKHVRPFRSLLQASSGVVLERLIQDAYDEVDRREVCMQWSASEEYRLGNHQHVAVFLPPIQCLSATRNQLRQKLAKFNLHDFSQLLIDLLKEIRRRYYGFPLQSTHESQIISPNEELNDISLRLEKQMNESRDYDEVADALKQICVVNNIKRSSEPAIMKLDFNENNEDNNDNLVSGQNISTLMQDNYLELKERLAETNEKVDAALQSNAKMLLNFSIIQNLVDRLQSEQMSIRCRFDMLCRNSNSGGDYYPKRVVSPTLRNTSRSISPPVSGEGDANVMPTSTFFNSTKASIDSHPLSKSSNHAHKPAYNHYRQRSLNTPMHVGSIRFSSSMPSAQPHSSTYLYH